MLGKTSLNINLLEILNKLTGGKGKDIIKSLKSEEMYTKKDLEAYYLPQEKIFTIEIKGDSIDFKNDYSIDVVTYKNDYYQEGMKGFEEALNKILKSIEKLYPKKAPPKKTTKSSANTTPKKTIKTTTKKLPKQKVNREGEKKAKIERRIKERKKQLKFKAQRLKINLSEMYNHIQKLDKTKAKSYLSQFTVEVLRTLASYMSLDTTRNKNHLVKAIVEVSKGNKLLYGGNITMKKYTKASLESKKRTELISIAVKEIGINNKVAFKKKTPMLIKAILDKQGKGQKITKKTITKPKTKPVKKSRTTIKKTTKARTKPKKYTEKQLKEQTIQKLRKIAKSKGTKLGVKNKKQTIINKILKTQGNKTTKTKKRTGKKLSGASISLGKTTRKSKSKTTRKSRPKTTRKLRTTKKLSITREAKKVIDNRKKKTKEISLSKVFPGVKFVYKKGNPCLVTSNSRIAKQISKNPKQIKKVAKNNKLIDDWGAVSIRKSTKYHISTSNISQLAERQIISYMRKIA